MSSHGFVPRESDDDLVPAETSKNAFGGQEPAYDRRRHEIRVPVWWREFSPREREVMSRALAEYARIVLERWDGEDAIKKKLSAAAEEMRDPYDRPGGW